MADPETAMLLSSVLEEIDKISPQTDASARSRAASRILRAALGKAASLDEVRQTGRETLRPSARCGAD